MNENETTQTTTTPEPETKKRTWVEEIEVAGSQLVEKLKDLLAEGNARRVIIRTKDGNELLAMPVTLPLIPI